MPTEHMSTEQRLSAAEKRKQALDLKLAGANYRQIQEALGYRSVASAHNAVMQTLRDIPRESAAKVRRMELARLDAALMAIWPAVTKGHLGAIDRMIAIMVRRAKYSGLDAPTKIDFRHMVDRVSDEMGLSAEEKDSLFSEVAMHLRETKVGG